MSDESYFDHSRLSIRVTEKDYHMGQVVDKLPQMKTRPRNRATPESLELGKRLLQALDKSGKSQSDLARALDVNRQTIQQLAAGYNDNPSFRRIVRIADELGVSARWLGLGEGPMTGEAALQLDEPELLMLYRALPRERQTEVMGYVRGIAGALAQRSPEQQALEDFVSNMSKDDAAKLAQLLSIAQNIKRSS